MGKAGGWFALLLGALCLPRPAPAAGLRLQRLDISRLPAITCYFTVVGKEGNSLLGLAEDDLALQVDGVPRKAARLSSAMDGGKYLAVAMLLDGSGSMRPHLEQARKAAAAFIDRASRLDQIAVLSCNEALTRHQDFSADRDLTRKALDAIQARGNTALHDAIGEVLVRFKDVSAPRRALLVLTDGRDNRSRSDADETIRLAGEAGVSLYTIGLGPASDDKTLSRLASESGGEFFKAAEARDLLAMYRRIGEHLSNQYILEFDLGVAGDGRMHEMQLAYRSPEGKLFAADQRFLAAVSPTLAPSAMASMQDRARKRRQYGQALPGALLGLVAGLLLLALLKLLRPSAPFFSWLGLALLGAFVLLGALVGFSFALFGP